MTAVAAGGWYLGRRLNRSYIAVQEAREAEQTARELGAAAQRSRAEFLSIASHELRNPVAVIRGFGQLLQRRLDRGSLNEVELLDYVNHVAGSGAHLSRLVEDLLSVSRLEGGRLELLLDDVDVLEVLRRAAAEAPVVDHSLSLATPDGPLLARIDADRVTQILVNLLENAAQYSPAGSEILVSVAVRGAKLHVTVTDSGIGLPQADLGRLFEPFARASNARGANISGLGLGLYVSRQLAEAHGGALFADSPGEDGGSTFTLTLPLSQDAEHAPAAPLDGVEEVARLTP